MQYQYFPRFPHISNEQRRNSSTEQVYYKRRLKDAWSFRTLPGTHHGSSLPATVPPWAEPAQGWRHYRAPGALPWRKIQTFRTVSSAWSGDWTAWLFSLSADVSFCAAWGVPWQLGRLVPKGEDGGLDYCLPEEAYKTEGPSRLSKAHFQATETSPSSRDKWWLTGEILSLLGLEVGLSELREMTSAFISRTPDKFFQTSVLRRFHND